jgi:hypothetical protein
MKHPSAWAPVMCKFCFDERNAAPILDGDLCQILDVYVQIAW